MLQISVHLPVSVERTMRSLLLAKFQIPQNINSYAAAPFRVKLHLKKKNLTKFTESIHLLLRKSLLQVSTFGQGGG